MREGWAEGGMGTAGEGFEGPLGCKLHRKIVTCTSLHCWPGDSRRAPNCTSRLQAPNYRSRLFRYGTVWCGYGCPRLCLPYLGIRHENIEDHGRRLISDFRPPHLAPPTLATVSGEVFAAETCRPLRAPPLPPPHQHRLRPPPPPPPRTKTCKRVACKGGMSKRTSPPRLHCARTPFVTYDRPKHPPQCLRSRGAGTREVNDPRGRGGAFRPAAERKKPLARKLAAR